MNDDKDARQWAAACHLAALAGLAIPLGNILGPLVIWLIKKNEYPVLEGVGKEAVNFQISITFYAIISFFLIFVLVGFILLVAVAISWLVLIIIAAVKASNGESYRYPLTIRVIT